MTSETTGHFYGLTPSMAPEKGSDLRAERGGRQGQVPGHARRSARDD
jgi:hypothetical protein